jgi:integral membrane protein (TIGR01906 family)
LVLNPWFVEFEYRTPNFPADPYGFTMQDRLRNAHIALDYLVNDAGINFLGDLRFPAGQQAPAFSCAYMDDCTRLYNDRELRHMVDVKSVVKAAIWVWFGSLAVLLTLNVVAWRSGWETAYRRALALGGWLTLAIIAAILLAVFLVFDRLFVLFHRIFFEGSSWLFLNSDTLIRLFPERFWSDTFTMVGVLTATMALAVGGLVKGGRRKGGR